MSLVFFFINLLREFVFLNFYWLAIFDDLIKFQIKYYFFKFDQDGKTLASGEDFAMAAEAIWRRADSRKKNSLIAVGVNCVSPDFVAKLFKSIRMKIPLVVYPNSGKFKMWQNPSICFCKLFCRIENSKKRSQVFFLNRKKLSAFYFQTNFCLVSPTLFFVLSI